jgi:uncharacterized protein with PhoU and TrkA domain
VAAVAEGRATVQRAALVADLQDAVTVLLDSVAQLSQLRLFRVTQELTLLAEPMESLAVEVELVLLEARKTVETESHLQLLVQVSLGAEAVAVATPAEQELADLVAAEQVELLEQVQLGQRIPEAEAADQRKHQLVVLAERVS